MDWQALETRLCEPACAFLEEVLAQRPGPLYAAAFHASHREQDGPIGLPGSPPTAWRPPGEDHPDRAYDTGFWSVK